MATLSDDFEVYNVVEIMSKNVRVDTRFNVKLRGIMEFVNNDGLMKTIKMSIKDKIYVTDIKSGILTACFEDNDLRRWFAIITPVGMTWFSDYEIVEIIS